MTWWVVVIIALVAFIVGATVAAMAVVLYIGKGLWQ